MDPKNREIVARNNIKIDQVYSSQWCRCKDTQYVKDFKEFVALNPLLAYHMIKKKEQIKELKNLFKPKEIR